MVFSVFLVGNSFAQSTFGLYYEPLFELGSFGIAKEGHFSHPQYVAVDNNGTVYVTDLGNKRVQKFSSHGEFLMEWGKSGKQPGEFRFPSGIAVSDGMVFVADRELNRIQKFSTDGQFITEWGEKGIRESQFLFPNGIAVNNGTVYVVDTGNQRVQTFSINGEFVSTFGSSGLGDGQFLTAVGIDIDRDGFVYVADRGNNKIEKFTAGGEFVESLLFGSFDYLFSPKALAVDPEGKMFVVNSATDKILHLPQTSDLALDSIERKGPFSSTFNVVTDVTFGINGELIIVDSARHNLKFYQTDHYVQPKVREPVEAEETAEETEEPVDNTKPEITVPASLEVEAVDLLTTLSYGEATATDESGIKTIINNAPDAFSPGTRNIIWIAFDNAGHSTSATQTITVKTCGASHSDYNRIEGTPEDDVIMGTDGDDLIFGLAGNDLISGGGGNDCIYGGLGDDVISGDDGNDTIRGNSGDDVLKGSSGVDVIYADSGSDIVDGGDDSDTCHPSDPDDLLLNCE